MFNWYAEDTITRLSKTFIKFLDASRHEAKGKWKLEVCVLGAVHMSNDETVN